MIGHLVEHLVNIEIDDIVVVTGYKRELVQEYLGKQVSYAYQDEQIGTGDAVSKVTQLADKKGSTLLVFGDCALLQPETLERVFEAHEGYDLTIASATSHASSNYSRVMRDSQGKIDKVVDHRELSKLQDQSSNEINLGVYCFDNELLFEYLPKIGETNPSEELNIIDLIKIMKEDKRKIQALRVDDAQEFMGVNDRVQLAKAQKWMQNDLNQKHLLNGVSILDPNSTYIGPDVQIEQDVTIYPGNHIFGKTTIKNNVTLYPANAKANLGDAYQIFLNAALTSILGDIKEDLNEFGVRFEQWFSEKSIEDKIEPALQILDEKGYLYEKEGNIWFKSTDFGDEKDRVVRRANGQTTYFASDIAYHKDKFDRGFDKVINVWGADHHGYVTRVKAALEALGIDPARLDVILVQFVALWRGEEKVQMSSRSGQFVTLRELREEVGNDAARFYYVARKPEMHIDFDLELAKSQGKDNLVYYIQYAHARVCRVLEKLESLGYSVNDAIGAEHQALLVNEAESELIKLLAAYPETLKRAATGYDPHVLTNYLKDLAAIFHGWYDNNRIMPFSLTAGDTPSDDELLLMQARLRLSKAVRQVIANGLSLLGLSAPSSM